MNSGRPPFTPRFWVDWLAIGAMWLGAHVPWIVARPLGAMFGAIAYVFAGRRRRIAETNLALAFPSMPQAERDALLRRCFRSIGLGGFEFIRAWWGSIDRFRRTTTIEGLHHITDELEKGRGVILLSGHFLTLEICGRLLCDHVPVAGMYRRHAGAVMEWAVKRGRMRYAAGMFAREEVRAAVKHLKAGGILWYAPDQDMRGKDAVFAPFFGVPAATITATHQLSRLSGAAVIGFFHRRNANDDGYVIRIEPPLADFPGPDAATDAARVNALIESMVREAPHEYLWIHRRYKRRPAGEPKLY